MGYSIFLARPREVFDPAGANGAGSAEALGTHESVWEQIQALIGPVQWSRIAGTPVPSSSSAAFERPDGWYEIRLIDEPVQCVSVRTSHRASNRGLIKELCVLLRLYAYDPQKSEIVAEP